MAIKGVNLGGWLVAERWITPSVFDGTEAVDEYQLSDTKIGRIQLKNHHQTFITEEDFQWLNKNGIEAVRIPIGYWIFGDQKPYLGAIDRLDWAFEMAQKYNIWVLVCLHGAPGSQNGQDHSGQIGPTNWHNNLNYRQQTIDFLDRLARCYSQNPKLWGIELLNEPENRSDQQILRDFYQQAYSRLNLILPSNVRIVFSDAFRPRIMAGVLRSSTERSVAMDIHWYHFGSKLRKLLSLSLFSRLVVAPRRQLIRRLQKQHLVIIGEWSGVIDYQKLIHYKKSKWSKIERDYLNQQLKTYDIADAWFYWTYKTESNDIWNFNWLVETGQIIL